MLKAQGVPTLGTAVYSAAQGMMAALAGAEYVAPYVNRVDVDRFAHVADMAEIEANGWNLNIPRYVDTFEEESEIDLVAVRAERLRLKAQLEELEAKMDGYLKELGY